MTERIKGLAKFYNAKLVGIMEMRDYHIIPTGKDMKKIVAYA
jgi:hypothetical protein